MIKTKYIENKYQKIAYFCDKKFEKFLFLNIIGLWVFIFNRKHHGIV